MKNFVKGLLFVLLFLQLTGCSSVLSNEESTESRSDSVATDEDIADLTSGIDVVSLFKRTK